MNAAYKADQLRNSGDAYRRFRAPGLWSSALEIAFAAMRHQLMGVAILLMGAAGFVGVLITFWP